MNKLIPKAALVMMSFMAVVFAVPKMALLLPAMDKATIGFDLTDEERNDFESKIVKIMKKGFKADIIPYTDEAKFIASTEISVATFLIEYFYLGSDVDAVVPSHVGHIAIRIHMFPDRHKNRSEVIALKATAEPGFGRNRPFESALKETFEAIESRGYSFSPGSDIVSSLNDVLSLKDVYPCRSTILLIAPQLDSLNMLYEMASEEKYDFSHQTADLLSDLTHFQVRLTSPDKVPTLQECYKMSAEIKFSRAEKTISFDLTNGSDPGKSFHDVSKAKNADDWNENKELTRDIFKAFKQFKKKYPQR
jgi:hypothetical protein